MPPALGILASIAISLAVSLAFRLISSLLSPPQRQQSIIGGNLPSADPGVEFTRAQAAAPHNIIVGEHRVPGNRVFEHSTDNNALLHLVIVWAGHECESLGDLYFDDEIVPLDGSGNATGKYAGYVICKDHLGAPGQMADATLIAAAGDKWTDEHVGHDTAYSYIQVRWNRTLFPSGGLPNMWRVAKGAKMYDPRTGLTVWSDNGALAIAWWLANAKFGRGASYDDMDLDALEAAANIADEEIDLASGGSEKRYTANGLLKSDVPFIDNLQKVASASLGTVSLIGGKWVVKVAAWEEPTIVFEEKDFRDVFTLSSGVSNAKSFNAVKGTFSNPSKLWQKDDYPAITSAAYEAEDGSREFTDAPFELTNSPSMAQRLARIGLRKVRQPLALTAKLKPVGLLAQAGDIVGIDNTFLGWSAKPFYVERADLVFGFAPGSTGSNRDVGIVGVDLTLRETSATIFDWDPAIDEQGTDPAPNTSLPDLLNPIPPDDVTVEEEQYVTRDGYVKVRANIEWPASIDAFVDRYRIRWKVEGDSDWRGPREVLGTSTSIDDVPPGSFQVGVAAAHSVAVSDYTSRSVTLLGLLDTPSDVEGFHLQRLGGAAILRWAPTVDRDVEYAGHMIIKHSSLTSGATWDTATSIGPAIPGRSHSHAVPDKQGTFLAKWRDSSGQYSPNAATVVSNRATALTFANIDSVVEDPTFSGTKTDCTVVSSKLRLDAGVDEGTYVFAGDIDLGGANTKARISSLLKAQVIALTDYWDSSEVSDSTEPWDSVVTGEEADAWVEIRETDDNPSGTPTWGPWMRLDATEVEAWGIQSRAKLTRSNADYSIEIEELAVSADEVA